MSFRTRSGLLGCTLMAILVLAMYACGGGGGGGSSAAPQAPTVATLSAVPAVENATLVGTVNPNGLTSTAWFEYSTSATLSGTVLSTSEQTVGDNTTAIQVTFTAIGLSPGTDYYYRVVGKNSVGTQKDTTIVKFTTVAPPPTAVTGIADNLSTTGATIYGKVNPNGIATNAQFEWGTAADLSSFTSVPLGSFTGKTDQNLSTPLTGLTIDTYYFYRIVGTNSLGNRVAGGIRSFKTLPNPLPIADAGLDQIVGPPNNSDNNGVITVTLNGSASYDTGTPPGTIAAWAWTKVSGPAISGINNATSAVATFAAPEVSYPNDNLVFNLAVTSSRGPYTNNDTTKVTVRWGFTDTFNTDVTAWQCDARNPGCGMPPPPPHTIISPYYQYYLTTGGYTVRVFVDPGVPDNEIVAVDGEGLDYDATYDRMHALMSNNHGVDISRDLPPSSRGAFSMDFWADKRYGEGPLATFRLKQDTNNYYEITNYDSLDDGYRGTPTISKVVNGVVVDSHPFLSYYDQSGGTNGAYHIKVTFSPTQTVWDAFGETYIDSTSGTITVNKLEMGFWQQDAFIDNILLEAIP